MTPNARISAALTALTLVLPASAHADDALRLELNAAETVQNKCRASFLIENKSDRAVESFKLDLVIFSTENTMQSRMVVEVGPVRRAKTIVRTYEIDRDCAQIGAILVNDIAACVPGTPGDCLDQLVLSSRVAKVRLFK